MYYKNEKKYFNSWTRWFLIFLPGAFTSLVRIGHSHGNGHFLKPHVTLGEDTGREIVKRSKGGAKGLRCLKGGNICAIVDNNLVAVLNEESPCCGKSTMVDIRQEIVEKLLLVRQPWEGEDLKNQQGDQGGSKGELTPQRSTGRVNRLHRKIAGGND